MMMTVIMPRILTSNLPLLIMMVMVLVIIILALLVVHDSVFELKAFGLGF